MMVIDVLSWLIGMLLLECEVVMMILLLLVLSVGCVGLFCVSVGLDSRGVVMMSVSSEMMVFIWFFFGVE